MNYDDRIDLTAFVCPVQRRQKDCASLENMPLAMAYVPWHGFEDLYDVNTALERGTVFPALDLPFCGKEAD